MRKKKYLIVLFILLLTLLLGLLSTSYATSFTESELKNIVYNSFTNFGDHDTEYVRNTIESCTYWSEMAQYTSDYTYVSILCDIYEGSITGNAINSNRYFYIYLSNRNDKPSMVTYNYCAAYYSYNFKNGTITKSLGGVVNKYMQQNGHDLEDVRYNDLPYYTNTSGTTITLQPGWHPSNIDEGIYYDTVWTFTPSTTNKASINGSQWDYYVIDNTSDQYNNFLGTIKNSLYVRQLELQWSTWDNGQKKYINQKPKIVYDYDRLNSTPLSVYYSGSTTKIAEGLYETGISTNTLNQDNNILRLKIVSSDPDLIPTLYYYYYFKNNYTNIVGNVIYPNITFSGDYANDYNQQQQTNDITGSVEDSTQEIKDTLTDTSGVNDLINENLSGDINTWGTKIGYTPIDNPFTTFLLNLVRRVYNALTQRGNVRLDFNHHGTTDWFINSSDFVTPDSPIKTLVKWCLVFLYIYGNYKYFHHLLTLVETARIDEAISTLGTDEFYDSDIM